MRPDKILHIFDMDGTLIKLPKLEDVAKIENGRIHSGDYVIDGAIDKMLDLSNKALNGSEGEKSKMQQLAGIKNKVYFGKGNDEFIYLFKNGVKADLSFVQDINSSNLTEKEKESILSKLDLKKGKLILGLFSEFFQTEGTVGVKVNEKVAKEYEKAKNKMILTGRSKGILKGVAYVLFNINGLSEPNYGLHMYTNSKGGIPGFKVNVIVNSIKENNWEEIHFYEDRKDWLDFAEKQVIKQFPKIKFHKHYVIS